MPFKTTICYNWGGCGYFPLTFMKCVQLRIALFVTDSSWRTLRKLRLLKSFYRKRDLWVVRRQSSASPQVIVLIIFTVAGIMLKNSEEVFHTFAFILFYFYPLGWYCYVIYSGCELIIVLVISYLRCQFLTNFLDPKYKILVVPLSPCNVRKCMPLFYILCMCIGMDR